VKARVSVKGFTLSGIFHSGDILCTPAFVYGTPDDFDVGLGQKFSQLSESQLSTLQLDVLVVVLLPGGALPLDHQNCLGGPMRAPHQIARAPDVVTVKTVDGDLQVALGLFTKHSPVLAAAFAADMTERTSREIDMTDTAQETVKDFTDCLAAGGLFLQPLLTHESYIHEGWTCDKSGICPIIGPRYHLKNSNYDLCEAEFNKLPPAEQDKYAKIEREGMEPWAWQRLAKLMVLADKYAVTALADSCEQCLYTMLTADNVAPIALFADTHGLQSTLLRGVVSFVASNPSAMNALTISDEYASCSGELTRLVHSFTPTEKEPPPYLNWRQSVAEPEFREGTDWEALNAAELRRACFERGLATAGVGADMKRRLSDVSPPAKRARTD
jgi:hypothetical protein